MMNDEEDDESDDDAILMLFFKKKRSNFSIEFSKYSNLKCLRTEIICISVEINITLIYF